MSSVNVRLDQAPPSLLPRGAPPPAPKVLTLPSSTNGAAPVEAAPELLTLEDAKALVAFAINGLDEVLGNHGDLKVTALELRFLAPLVRRWVNGSAPEVMRKVAPRLVPEDGDLTTVALCGLLLFMGFRRWLILSRREDAAKPKPRQRTAEELAPPAPTQRAAPSIAGDPATPVVLPAAGDAESLPRGMTVISDEELAGARLAKPYTGMFGIPPTREGGFVGDGNL